MNKRCRLQLIDLCLIIFMILLFGQMIFALFFGVQNPQSATLDVIFRTTAASIFGYFLSANFTTRERENCEQSLEQTPTPPIKSTTTASGDAPRALRNPIGFASPGSSEEPAIGSATTQVTPETQKAIQKASNMQVIIATCFGVAALLVLFIVRDFKELTPELTSAVTQMRDFFSGCVGFLLGSKTSP